MSLRPDRAVREALTSARAHPVTTWLLVLVTAGMTAVTFLTAGRAAAAEEQILSSVDAAGPRIIVLTVEEPAPGLTRQVVSDYADLPDVSWVLALGVARDVRVGATGARSGVAARDLLSPLPAEVSIERGRTPRAGEALVSAHSQRALRLAEPSGYFEDNGQERSVVGRFVPTGGVATLDRLVLVVPPDGPDGSVTGAVDTPETSPHATLVYVLAQDAQAIERLVERLRASSGLADPSLLHVQTAPELVELEQVLRGQVGTFSRQIALGAIGTGVALVLLTMTLALSSRRRDFGRRRALGSTRSALVALVALEAAIPVLLGVAIGTVGGMVAIGFGSATMPGPGFVLGVITLVSMAGTAGALLPALLAARQDPVSILRVP